MDTDSSALSALVLAVASSFAADLVISVAGNDLADTIQGSPLSRKTLFTFCQQSFQQALTQPGEVA